MTRAALLAALALALLTGAYAWGASHARAAMTAEIAAAREAAREADSRRETQRLALEAERARIATAAEDAANATPVAHPECFPAERVRRLDGIR